MTRVSLVFLSLLALTLGAGCKNTCSNACSNIAQVCASDFQKQNQTFDASACTANCKANLNGCSNINDQVDCSVKAQSCGDLSTCPSCF